MNIFENYCYVLTYHFMLNGCGEVVWLYGSRGLVLLESRLLLGGGRGGGRIAVGATGLDAVTTQLGRGERSILGQHEHLTLLKIVLINMFHLLCEPRGCGDLSHVQVLDPDLPGQVSGRGGQQDGGGGGAPAAGPAGVDDQH